MSERRAATCSAVFLLLMIASSTVFAQRGEPQLGAGPVGVRDYGKPASLTGKLPAEPAAKLKPASVGAADDLAALNAWNAAGRRPARNGFTRALAAPVEVRYLEAAAGKDGASAGMKVTSEKQGSRAIVAASVFVEGAHRLRLHLTNLRLGPDAVLWVWASGGAPIGFSRELAGPAGDIWAPSVEGETVFLQIEGTLPSDGNFGVTIGEVLEIVVGEANGTGASPDPAGFECLTDASCVTPFTLDVVDAYRFAVAHLEYVEGGDSYVCSGGLVNDNDDSTVIPYLLTANHCFDDQASTSTLEAFWDYRTNFCDGSAPSLSSLPRSNGASLMATSPRTDFTFVRLNSIPGGRALLGWDSRPGSVVPGTRLHRISHPAPSGALPQQYSSALVTTETPLCLNRLPKPQFIYTHIDVGATVGGSSGAPVILQGGYVVGQLYGKCGEHLDDVCDERNLTVDGAFSETYPLIASFLTGQNECGACVPDGTTACLLNNRFRVKVRWRNRFFDPATSGDGMVVRYAENTPEVHPTLGALSENSFWSMFAHAPKRVELVVKIFKGAGINEKYWIYVSGLTNNEYWVTVTDTQTCRVWERYNEHNEFGNITDFEAFPFP